MVPLLEDLRSAAWNIYQELSNLQLIHNRDDRTERLEDIYNSSHELATRIYEQINTESLMEILDD